MKIQGFKFNTYASNYCKLVAIGIVKHHNLNHNRILKSNVLLKSGLKLSIQCLVVVLL